MVFEEDLQPFRPIYGDMQKRYYSVIAEYVEAKMARTDQEFKFFTKFAALNKDDEFQEIWLILQKMMEERSQEFGTAIFSEQICKYFEEKARQDFEAF